MKYEILNHEFVSTRIHHLTLILSIDFWTSFHNFINNTLSLGRSFFHKSPFLGDNVKDDLFRLYKASKREALQWSHKY